MDNREANVISKFRLRPRSAGTKMKTSVTFLNTSQCYKTKQQLSLAQDTSRDQGIYPNPAFSCCHCYGDSVPPPCGPGCPESHCVDQASLKYRDCLLCPPECLGLKAWDSCFTVLKDSTGYLISERVHESPHPPEIGSEDFRQFYWC